MIFNFSRNISIRFLYLFFYDGYYSPHIMACQVTNTVCEALNLVKS